MNRITIWQLFFIIGLVACIVASAVAFGPAWALGVTGVVAIIIRLLTGLIGPGEAFISSLKRLLNVSLFLKPVTVVVWMVAIVLGIHAARQVYQLISPPPPTPPFRVTYYRLERYAVDLFLDGKIDKRWEARLEGKWFIVPNGVLKSVSYLHNTFAESFSGAQFVVSKGESNTEDIIDSDAGQQYQYRKVFSGYDPNLNVDFDPSVLPKYFHLMEDPNRPWKIFDDPYTSILFRTYVDQSDLGFLANSTYKEFILYLAKNRLPPDFGYIDIYARPEIQEGESGTCDQSELLTVADFVGRIPALRVAVIENVTDHAITLDRFTIRENQQTQLRTPNEDKASFDDVPSDHRDLFTVHTLKVGERIVVPVQLLLTFDPKDNFSRERKTRVELKDRPDLLSDLKKLKQLSFHSQQNSFKVGLDTIDRMLGQPMVRVPLNDEYVYGPSVRIDSVEVGGFSYPFREYDPSKTLTVTEGQAGEDIGSCPYLYSYSLESKSWIDEGVVLYGLGGKRKESVDKKQLSVFDGKLLIKEKDAEESYIDSVYVKAIGADGKETILRPTNPAFRFIDHQYLRLNQGEQVQIDFDHGPALHARKYFVVVVGYYVPYNQGRERRLGTSSR
jgi:hypothetical protein